ncbi:hemolysin family protein [Mycobacterium sp. NPDC006124]|uniref:hemolysin family protein n=1 Tax=Mycobacterium sp. NPDC006124 TaxID=3156729 RepID=UPI0033A9E018
MNDLAVIVLVSAGLIAASAFFVAVEFALIAARKHRLEDIATQSRSARAALRSSSELSVLLAGSQLGITVCTLLLGAVTKPAVHDWLTPLIASWGSPSWVADAGGFVLALTAVTFLHLVVGEMAPKSWAIAHPERSAVLLAIPMRAFMWVTRPVIVGLNHVANWCLRRVGVEPVDHVSTGQDPETLRHLVEHSATAGTLDEQYHRRLSGALQLQGLEVGDIVDAGRDPVEVSAQATGRDVQEVSHHTGHMRVVVRDGSDAVGVVHVRDTLAAPDVAAASLMRPALQLAATTPAYTALTTMRDARTHVAIVFNGDGRETGLVTMTDVLARLMPEPVTAADR